LCAVQQTGYARRTTVRGADVKVGHAPPEQRVPLAKIVVDVETGEHSGNASTRLIHLQQLSHGIAECAVALIGTAERDLRHGIAQHQRAGSCNQASSSTV
jgi:hypothetical protein